MMIASIIAATAFLCLAETAGIAGTITLRAGIYENRPKLFLDEDGKPRGIFIDIMNDIAKNENWNIEYVFGEWNDNIVLLEKGELDLLLDVSFSDDRASRFSFNSVPVLTDWLQVFVRSGIDVDAISEMRNKKIAVLKGSVQERYLQAKFKKQFKINFTLLSLPDYPETARAVRSGEADMLVASRFFYHSDLRRDDIRPTSVVFRPESIYFAMRNNLDSSIVAAIDRNLFAMKNNPDSVFYRSLNRWLEDPRRYAIPRYVRWMIIITVFFLSLGMIVLVFLRIQVRSRTKELRSRNEELCTAMAELNRAMDDAINRERLHALGQMAGGMAHDFNNTLVPIIGFTDILLADPKALDNPEEVRHALMNIKEAVRDSADMVMRMRDFYRNRGKTVSLEMIDMQKLLEDVLAMTRPRWDTKTRSGMMIIAEKKYGSPCTVRGGKSEIREMFINLIFNAVDAMPEGGILTIEAGRENDRAKIIVGDTGIGMTEEVRAGCLRPFYTTKGDHGTGIGLAMVNQTVIRHNGTIEIDSEPGKGTRFIISLPCDPGEGNEHPHPG